MNMCSCVFGGMYRSVCVCVLNDMCICVLIHVSILIAVYESVCLECISVDMHSCLCASRLNVCTYEIYGHP